MSKPQKRSLDVICDIVTEELKASEKRMSRLGVDCKKLFAVSHEFNEDELRKAVQLTLKLMAEHNLALAMRQFLFWLVKEKPENIREALRHYIT